MQNRAWNYVAALLGILFIVGALYWNPDGIASTPEAAIGAVRAQDDVRAWESARGEAAQFSAEETEGGGQYAVRAYENNGAVNATFGYYLVDKRTGTVEEVQ